MKEGIAEDLRIFRRKLRFTQDELARKIGATRSQYANWEHGAALPPQEFMLRLRELGFQAPPGFLHVAEPTAMYAPRATSSQLQLLIDILYDTSIADAIRTNAKAELEAALSIDKKKI